MSATVQPLNEVEQELVKSIFNTIDVDGSNSVEKEELLELMKKMATSGHVLEFDFDSLNRQCEKQFQLMDLNGDGMVSYEELAAYVEQHIGSDDGDDRETTLRSLAENYKESMQEPPPPPEIPPPPSDRFEDTIPPPPSDDEEDFTLTEEAADGGDEEEVGDEDDKKE